MKLPFAILVAMFALACLAREARSQVLTTETFSGLSLSIPDDNSSGNADTESISGIGGAILDLNVTLTIEGDSDSFGAFNGDFYAYLTHGSAIAILLNRPGKTAANSLGYGDNGFANVTFDDSAAHDIHNYQLSYTGSPVTGAWQPDGRKVPPGEVLDTDPRSNMLDQFNNLDPNGSWRLFVADLSAGGTGTLTSWALQITAVPEIPQSALFSGSLLLLAGLIRKFHFARKNIGR